jgi:protein-S-isoprenylcysteine O-methyltransferase Ste14
MLTMLASIDPGLRRERFRGHGYGGIDRRLRGLIALCLLAHLLLAGFDLRFGWSPALSTPVHAAGLLVYTAGLALAIRAMVANRFFAPAVRIQTERGQRVVTSGPYRFVRHPGYAGMIVAVIGECFVFGSLAALIPAIAMAAAVAWRTAREDRLLRAELAGYMDYARRVRYRLLPSVW